MTKRERWLIGSAVVIVPLVMLLLLNALVIQPEIGEVGAETRGNSGAMNIRNPVTILDRLNVSGEATFFSAGSVAGVLSAGSVTSTGTISAAAVTATGAVNAASVSSSGAISATSVVSAASLALGNIAQSGAVRYGSAGAVISGTTIAHGIGMTPTLFIVQNAALQSAEEFTQTVYGFGCNTLSCTVGVSAGAVVTFAVKWIAGK